MKKARKIEGLFEVLRVILSMVIAYVVALVVLYFVADDPAEVIKQFVIGPFSSQRRIGSMINLAVPFIMCGLGMCFVYSVNKLNVLGEGIFMLSACIITWIGLYLGQTDLPSFAIWIILIGIGGIIGALCMVIPAYIDVKIGASVVVVSIMAIELLSEFAQYILQYVIRDTSTSFLASYSLNEKVLLPRFFKSSFKIQSAIIIALICVVLVYIFLYKTKHGYKMRMVGSNPNMAKISGMNITATVVLAHVLGGVLAGMGGAIEMLSNYTRFQWTAPTGHGYDGLLVAVLAKKNPKYVPITAMLLAYIRIGSDVVNSSCSIPSEFISVIQCIIILLVAAEMFLTKQRDKIIQKNAEEELKSVKQIQEGK